MNTFMRGLKEENNYTLTENLAVTYKSSLNAVLDLFGMGAAYRKRSDSDCIVLFKKAFAEDPVLAMKCLFYIRDIEEGQGERRFFRVVAHWLADNQTEAMRRNLKYVPTFGRFDDMIYICYKTKLWNDCIEFLKTQLTSDIKDYESSSKAAISLLGKWLPSENTSSAFTRELANAVREGFGMTHKQYRKTLSLLRERINVLERLMSANKWEEIEFDKIPSKAGFIYRKAFQRHDIERKKADPKAVTYEEFVKDEKTKVNAKDLYPYEVVAQAYNLTKGCYSWWGHRCDELENIDPIQRAAINKYWDNLKDYFNGCTLDALCVIDTSGSMTGCEASAPINVAISLGLYAAERARGPFAGHYVSFSSRPQLIETVGVDFVDKVWRIYKTNLCDNTNIEATFDMLLKTALKNHCRQEDLPKSIIIVSDMQWDSARGYYGHDANTRTLMENIALKWQAAGYRLPELIYWNVDARTNANFPMKVQDGVTFVSGFSPVIFQMIMQGKSGLDLMLDKLNSERYSVIK